jgi:hypothetical protein
VSAAADASAEAGDPVVSLASPFRARLGRVEVAIV